MTARRTSPTRRFLVRAVRSGLALACLLAATVAAAQTPGAGQPPTPPSPASKKAPDPAVVACAEAVARRVQARYESIRDLQAAFEQVTKSVSLGTTAMEGDEPVRGHVVFAKPGRMRWSYEEPTPSLMVSNGKSLWIYDPTAHEASHLPVDEGYLTGAALQFLMGEGDLLETFDVRADRCEPGSSEAIDLELVPREPATYERMSLRADPRTGEVRETTIVDLFGNTTTVRFSDVRTNFAVDPKLFEWKPPEGVSVVDLLAPP